MPDPPYVVVDVETSGPVPGLYSLLSIGACLARDLDRRFYAELQPLPGAGARPDALAISGLSPERLAQIGLPPEQAMARFQAWLQDAVPEGSPILVAFNAPFDWAFVDYYFHRFAGDNPFGHTALDMKAFYMGLAGVEWRDTGMRAVSARYPGTRPLTHNALQDALDQARLFIKMLNERKSP